MPDVPMDDRLRHDLGDAAADVDPGDATTGLAAAHATARRRRRRRVTGLTALGVLAVVTGLVAALTIPGDGPDRISTADTPPTTEEIPLTTEAAADDGAPAEDDGEATEPDPTAEVGPDPAAADDGPSTDEPQGADVRAAPRVVPGSSGTPIPVAGFESGTPGAPSGWVDWLVPWQDGFLAGRTDVSQPRPEPLSEELQSRFPQEVRDLFPDGLPPTIGEAQEILAEADLLDEVTELVTEDQELYDALFAAEPDVRLVAGSSPDGETWTPVELSLPLRVGMPQQVVSTGDRLVVVGAGEGGPTAAGPGGDPGPRRVFVASTTDLTSWAVQSVPLDAPTDLPEPFVVYSGQSSVAVNEDRWVLTTEVGVDVEPERFFEELGLGPEEHGGYSIEFTSDPPGAVITVDARDGSVLAERQYRWDDLGLDDGQIAALAALDRWGSLATQWTATWGGDPVESRTAAFPNRIAALGSGFLQIGDPLLFSADGRSWSPVTAAPDAEWVDGVLAIPSGGVVLTQDRIGVGHLYRIDATASHWEEITVEGAPDALRPLGFPPTTAATIVDGSPLRDHEQTIVVEGEGGRLTLTRSRTSQSYELVDAGGAVVATETIDLATDDDGEFDHLQQGSSEQMRVTDADTGETIFSANRAQVREAYRRAEPPPEAIVEQQPDFWLLATNDGGRWLVHDLPEGPSADEPSWWPEHATVSGGTVLVPAPDRWLRFELPT